MYRHNSDFHVNKIPRKKGVLILYGAIVALGMLFFIDPIVDSKIASFSIICVIRFLSSSFEDTQRCRLH